MKFPIFSFAALLLPLLFTSCEQCGGSASSSDSDSVASVAEVDTVPAFTDLVFTVHEVEFSMIAVNGGSFSMGGTPEQEGDSWDEEQPVHTVNLSDFHIGQTEVTWALWQAVMGADRRHEQDGSLPVTDVSWDDCQTFIAKLNSLTGSEFRLPTEAEWEYACRGGQRTTGYKFGGSDNAEDVANFWANGEGQLKPIMTKHANELGLYDMSGNVFEWCQDYYAPYPATTQYDPQGPDSGDERVYRGGSWDMSAWSCRVSARACGHPDQKGNNIGLRLAL